MMSMSLPVPISFSFCVASAWFRKHPSFAPPELVTQYCTVSCFTMTAPSALSASDRFFRPHGSGAAFVRSRVEYALGTGVGDSDGVADPVGVAEPLGDGVGGGLGRGCVLAAAA